MCHCSRLENFSRARLSAPLEITLATNHDQLVRRDPPASMLRLLSPQVLQTQLTVMESVQPFLIRGRTLGRTGTILK